MPRPECSPDEQILRAIHSAHWDKEKNHWSSEIFKGEKKSVSRLAILSLEELLVIFHQELDSSPKGSVIAAGEINVGLLKKIGREHSTRTELTVEQDPIPSNLAHAEIPQKISKGLARAIIKELKIHWDTDAS